MVIKVAVPHQFKLKVIPDFRSLFFSDKKDIHYIGGSDILPAPLETEEERKAIRGLGTENDEQARKMLIEHNLRLVVYIAKKFDNTGVGVEVTVDESHINSIRFTNLNESITTMYPFIEPAIEDIAEQVYKKQSLDNIQYSSDTPYTSQLIVQAIETALKKAGTTK